MARKSSDTSSSESTSVTGDEHGCGSFIINFLHLRSHALDAVVDDAAKAEDADAGMMEEDLVLQDDAGGIRESDATKTQEKARLDTQPTKSSHCASPSPKDIQGKKHSGTKTPMLPPQRNVDIVDIFSNENQSSIDLTIPKLSKSSPPESLPQTHLITDTAGHNIDEDSPSSPSLSLHSVSAAQTYDEGMMSHIPRIHLRMRNSRQPVVYRVTEDIDQSNQK